MGIQKNKELILKSVLAGMLIALCGLMNIIIDNKYVAAFLFSFGLLTILIRQYNLYTGKVHLLLNKEIHFIEILMVLLGNFIGCLIIGILVRFCTNINSDLIWANKLNHSYVEIIFFSILCGILMYLAVSGWKNNKEALLVVMPIMIFILTGADHSIANIFYMSVASKINFNIIVYIVINIIGNAIGSLFFYKMELIKGGLI